MNPSQYPMNQFAPTYFQGLQISPDSVYDPKPYTYLYSPSTNSGALSPGATLINESVSIEVDSDFLLLGWYISLYTDGGVFQIQLLDSTGYQLFSNFLNSAAISQSSSDPTIFSPPHPFPAGGRIQIDITDLSGTENFLQIAFVGMKLFRKRSS